MVSWNGVMVAVFLAIFIFGGMKLVNDNQINTDLKATLVNQTFNNPLGTAIFVKTVDEITPTLKYKLPFTDKSIYGINEFPLPSWIHLLVITTLILISSFIMRSMKVTVMKQILVFFILIIIGYYIGTWIIYFTYYWSSSSIGLLKEQATTFRTMYSNNLDNILLPLVIIAGFSMFVIFKTIFKQLNKR